MGVCNNAIVLIVVQCVIEVMLSSKARIIKTQNI